MYSIESFINYVYEDDIDYATEGIRDIGRKASEKLKAIGKWITEKAKSFGKWIMNIILSIKSKFSKNGKSCNGDILKEGMKVINNNTQKDAKESLLDSLFSDKYDIVLEGNNTKKNKQAEKQNEFTNLALSKQKNKLKKELSKLNTIKNGTYNKPGRELTVDEKNRYRELLSQIEELGVAVTDNRDKISNIKNESTTAGNETPNYAKNADLQQKTADIIEEIAKKYDNDPELKDLAKVFRKHKTRVKVKDLPASSAMNIVISESKKTSDAVNKETEKIIKAIKEDEKRLLQIPPSIIGGGSDYIIGQGLEPSNTKINLKPNKPASTNITSVTNNQIKNVVENSVKKQNWFVQFIKRIIKKIKAIIDTLKVSFA